MDLGRRTYVLGACGSVCTGGTRCGNDRETASSPTSAEGARTALAAARLIYANASSSDAWQMGTTTIPRRGLWRCRVRRALGDRAVRARGQLVAERMVDAVAPTLVAWAVLPGACFSWEPGSARSRGCRCD